MYNGQTVSLKTVLWKVLNNPLAAELTYELAAEYAIEVIKLLGAPLTFVDKVTPPLEIVNHKVALPDNLINIRGIRYLPDPENPNDNSKALRYATDVYHSSEKCGKEESNIDELTYTVNNGVLFTSFPDGHIQVSYKSLPVDDDGYPLIPDNQKTIMAMEYYILFRFIEPLWTMGKVTDKVFNYIDTKKCFYMASADNSLKLNGPDQMQSIVNSISRLIINDQAHSNFWRGAGEQERLRRYN